METFIKSEVNARLNELNLLLGTMTDGNEIECELIQKINKRRSELTKQLKVAEDDLFTSVLRSHKVLCEVKQMDEKAAYGQDPALYYGAGVAGEAGELLNKVVKALRNGNNTKATKEAVISELPDVFIYGVLLAYCLDINLTELIAEKAEVVIQRALDGYYGGPITGVSNISQISIENYKELQSKLENPVQLEWDWRSKPWEAVNACFNGTELVGIVWASDQNDAYEIAEKWFPGLHDTDGSDSLAIRKPLDTRVKMYESIPMEKRITKNMPVPVESKEQATFTIAIINQLFNG